LIYKIGDLPIAQLPSICIHPQMEQMEQMEQMDAQRLNRRGTTSSCDRSNISYDRELKDITLHSQALSFTWGEDR
jgi:hypothetical protein